MTITPESRIPLSIFVSAIGGAFVTAVTGCTLWFHMDAVLQSKVSMNQFQGFAVQLQNDNPLLKVTIPGIQRDANFNDGSSGISLTNLSYARRSLEPMPPPGGGTRESRN